MRRQPSSENRNGERDIPLDLPLPEAHFRDLGSRTTFYRWEKAGLRVLRVGNRRFIRPSDLEKFMVEMDAKHTAQHEKEEGDE